jgi:hypothetical protein
LPCRASACSGRRRPCSPCSRACRRSACWQYWSLDDLAPPTGEELADALRPFLRGADEVFAPAGIHNPDHKLVRDAVLAVRPEATLYADLPYALHPDLGGFEPPADAPTRAQRQDRRLGERPTTAKVDACLCYSTQLRQLTDFFGDFLDPGGLGLEVYWPAR